MSKISMLRAIVNNGWTIANRRAVCSQIGKSNFKSIVESASQSGIDCRDLKYDMFENFIKPKIDITWIGNEAIKIEDRSSINAFINLVSSLKESKALIKTLPPKVNWNSEKYIMFRLLDENFACQNGNLKILMGTDNKILTKLKDLLFKGCKPLGRTEIHYRVEGFDLNESIKRELFERINSVKVGDTYNPKTFLWTTNDQKTTIGYGGFAPDKYVHYKIIYSPESKIIEHPIKSFGKNVTEAVTSRDTKFKILEKESDEKNIYITMQSI